MEAKLSDQLASMQLVIQQQQQQMQQHQQQMQQQQQQIAELLTKNTQSTHTPKPKIAIPSKFNGDKKTARQFVAQCTLYFEVMGAQFPTPRSKIVFLVSLLEGQAAKWALPLLERSDLVMTDLTQFHTAFFSMFGEQNPRRKAEDTLRSLRQQGSVADYVTAFRMHCAESEWNDVALTSQFYWGLSEAVKDQLLRLDEPSTLEDLIKLTLRIDDRLALRRAQRPHGQAGAGGANSGTSGRLGHPKPTLDQGSRRTWKPLTDSEKAERRAKGLCMYCGANDHLIAQCPTKKPRQVRALEIQEARVAHVDSEINPPVYEYSQCHRHLSTPVTLAQKNLEWATAALIDSGAEGNFMDSTYANQQGIVTQKKTNPEKVVPIDGRPIQPGIIDREAACTLRIGEHSEEVRLDIIHTPKHPIILGHPWLWRNDPKISWKKSTIDFPQPPTTHITDEPGTDSHTGKPAEENYETDATEEKDEEESIEGEVERLLGSIGPPIPEELSTPSDGDHGDGDKEVVPPDYTEFTDVFSKVEADKLPPRREYDCPIDLIDGKVPPFGPIYSLSEPELQSLRDYLKENLEKGFIVPSKSPAASPILFQRKKDGSLRLCVDYRKLNEITQKNRYPLPLIPEIIERLRGAKIFTKLDLRGAYNLVRMREGDEWKTAFRTRYGLYEYVVMPFGLTNAPATFQALMNDIFRDLLDVTVIIYLDDIMVFSETPEDHVAHVKEVLRRLREHRLYSKLSKCEFHRSTVEFLGFVITPEGVEMDKSKVQSILDWKRPGSLKEIQSFLGFANFYRRFIPNFSTVVSPLTKLLRKGAHFEWTAETQAAFDQLKSLFVSDLVLIHPDPTKAFVVETDTSNFALGCVLSQLHTDGRLHPCAFYSRSLNDHERNYDIHDKELLAIKTAFEQWRHLLEGAAHEVTVLTDHRNLEYFKTKAKILTQRHAHWSNFLSGFRFVLTYRPGLKNGKPDALSRREEYRSEGGETPCGHDGQPTDVTILKPTNFDPPPTSDTPERQEPQLGAISTSSIRTEFADRLQAALTTDPLATAVQNHWTKVGPQTVLEMITQQQLGKLSQQGSYIVKEGRLYVPQALRVEVLQSRHDDPTAGHYGVARTRELVTRSFWWPGLKKDVEQFVRSCDTCGRAKSPRHKKFGELQPLPTPEQPWQSISMDFITDLPVSEGHTTVLVVVDRLTKMSHFIPLVRLPGAEQTAEAVVRNVFKLHGLPKDIVSDRGPQFASKFWRRFMDLLGVKVKLSTAFHPETDGQTERVNQTLEQYLRCFINYQQDDWSRFLPLAEFTYNNTIHSSTGFTPFFANYGHHPSFDPRIPDENQVPQAEDRITLIDQTLEQLKQHLHRAKERYKYYADHDRRPAPKFQVGDQVWLLSRNVSTERPSKKLDYKRLGPFPILETLSDRVCRLDLPHTLRIHPVFHVSLLEPYVENQFPNRTQPPPPPVVVDGELEYVVSEILDSRTNRGNVQYLVDWKGYGPADRSWEPASHVEGNEQVQIFHQRYPGKPKPPQAGPGRGKTVRFKL